MKTYTTAHIQNIADNLRLNSFSVVADMLQSWIAEREASHVAVAASTDPLSGKYGNVLRPFVCLMERELHANAGKGDRPGWLAMDRKTALLEIFYHLAKLQKAVKDDCRSDIREHAADVANMSMMLVDVCGALLGQVEAAA